LSIGGLSSRLLLLLALLLLLLLLPFWLLFWLEEEIPKEERVDAGESGVSDVAVGADVGGEADEGASGGLFVGLHIFLILLWFHSAWLGLSWL